MNDRPDPRWDIDLEYGSEGEDTVREALGLGSKRLEVKRKRYADGQFYIELYQRPRWGKVKPSGLQTTEADYYAFLIASTGVIVLVPTARLNDLVAQFEMG